MASPTPAVDATVDSAINYVKTSAFNASSFLIPSSKDLLYLFPRMAARAGAFVTDDIPGAFENIFGGPFGGRVLEQATAGEGGMGTVAAATAANILGGAAQNEAPLPDEGFFTLFQYFGLHQLRTFGGVFTYLTSKWALGCFAVSVVLKRTTIYASTRRNLTLNWQVRALLRILPILVLLSLCHSLTRSIRCQMSPDFSEMRYGDHNKYDKRDYSGEGGLLYQIASAALFYESDLDSCVAVEMISTDEHPLELPNGSLAMLWPSFQAFSLAQFAETIINSLQNIAPATETGMTLFEHSLAFAEAEAMISNQLGLGAWFKSQPGKPSMDSTADTATRLVTKSFLVTRFNVPPEVLLVSLISCLNNLSSQILGVFGKQAKYRLINTGIWGVAFMGAFSWGFFKSSIDQGLDAGIFRFPTVCVVGFIPHTLILTGIFLCASIYALALIITMIAPPESFPQNMTLKERFWTAQQNMQANIPLSTLKVDMKEDFYTSLLRTGLTALTAASEAVFLNEGQRIRIGHWTWIEEEQMQRLTKDDAKRRSPKPGSARSNESSGNPANQALTDIDTELLKGGYARERSTETLKIKSHRSVRESDGVGAGLRGARYLLAFRFFSGIFWLLMGWFAISTFRIMAMVGITWRPRWLSSIVPDPVTLDPKVTTVSEQQHRNLEFWVLSDNGELSLPRNNDVDIATETKRRLQLDDTAWSPQQESQLENKLYSWFVHGGWWGERDDSEDYRYDAQDEDTTSVISMSTAITDNDSSDASGPPTPTQSDYDLSPTPQELSSDLHIEPTHLARLLNPRDSEARDEARMLAAHLTSDRPVTRSRYRGGDHTLSKSNILTSTRYRPPGFTPSNPSGSLTRDEEAEVLEYLVVKFREQGRQSSASARADWASGGEGMGAGGPQCVVCQTAPRTILAWPCRCLSLCDECRINLAMNNFGSCVCCRQEVVAFSRLFVP